MDVGTLNWKQIFLSSIISSNMATAITHSIEVAKTRIVTDQFTCKPEHYNNKNFISYLKGHTFNRSSECVNCLPSTNIV